MRKSTAPRLCCDCKTVEIPKGNSKRCPDCRKQKNIEYDRGRKRDKFGYGARDGHKKEDPTVKAKCPRCKCLHSITVKRIPISTIYQYCDICGITANLYAGSGMV
jgi:hypothetical protein